MSNKKQITIVKYSNIYTMLHQEFAQRNWGKKRRGDINYLRFKHRETKEDIHENLIIALVGNRVVGQIGLIPNSLVLSKQKIDSYWICDLMVEKQYRKLGIAIELYKYVIKKKQVLFGSYPSKKSEILLKLLKFKKIKGPKLLFFPINFKALLKFKYGNLFWFQFPSLFYKISEFLYIKYYNINYYNSNDIESLSWDELYQIHFESQKRIKEPHMLHDRKFLGWRGNGFEGFTEKIRGIKSSDGSSYIYFDMGSDCLYLVDFDIKNKSSGREILGSLVSIAKKYKKNRLQLASNTSSQNEMLKDLGWLEFTNPITLYYYTSKPEHKLENLYFTLYDSDGNL